jgi:hypothetical protein
MDGVAHGLRDTNDLAVGPVMAQSKEARQTSTATTSRVIRHHLKKVD